MTTFTNDFSREIYEQTYRMGDETINSTQKRVADYLASIEKDKAKYETEFLWALENFKFVPGGRITSNAGLDLQGTTLINCFVSAPEGEDVDSMVGIHREIGNQMMILKCEGGYGFCASFMRPRGSFIAGIANFSPGAVEMLNIWDASSATITAGPGKKYNDKNAKGKIRKGAQMVTMHCWHPDVCEFVVAKQQPGRLTKFNMSVLITDEFMDAIKNNKAWNLEYPDYSHSPEVKAEYKKTWDGDLAAWKAKGHPVKIYHSYENANELYNIIMESTYNRNEPGVLFIDTINKLNNLYYCESIKATNPCVTADTWVKTSKGLCQVEELIDEPFKAIVNGQEYDSTAFWQTGVRTVYEIRTCEGYKVTATKNHYFAVSDDSSAYKWMQVKDLKNGDKLCLANKSIPVQSNNTHISETLMERFQQLSNLREGWDDDEAVSIKTNVLAIAQRILASHLLDKEPELGAVEDGRLDLVWTLGGRNSFFTLDENDIRIQADVSKEMRDISLGDGDEESRAEVAIKIIYHELYSITATVKSITKLPEPQPVYDCTVQNVHAYDANGFLSHNCGEQALPPGGVCLLGSINLTQFVIIEKQEWDYLGLRKIIPIIIRMLDNVNDLTLVPLEIQRWNLTNKRRIGLGVLGYGSALMMIKVRYGSEQALGITDKLMQFIRNEAYCASVDLAKEKGAFPLFDKEQYLAGNFVRTLDEKVKKLISKHGIRNSHLLSIQPTGNSSVYANNVSGGLEPIWQPVSVRTTNMPNPPEGLHLPTNVDWINKKATMKGTDWHWKKEGDETLLYVTFAGYTWKMDKSRGLLRETEVVDYSVHVLRERGEWDSEADWVATVPTLSIDEHIKTMQVFSKYIDSSMSKTVNLPKDYRFNAFKKLYMDAYDTGTIKGVTTYRDGTMAYVLSSVDKPADIVPSRGAPPRPKKLVCDIHVVNFKRVRHIVLIGMMNGKPYEVFSFREKDVRFTNKLKNGILVKMGSGKYALETDAIILEDLNKNFDRCEESLITRLISLSLRNGVCINDIYEQLNKSGDTVASFSRVIARTLSHYVTEVQGKQCTNCDSSNGLLFQEGCITCRDCGWAKCS